MTVAGVLVGGLNLVVAELQLRAAIEPRFTLPAEVANVASPLLRARTTVRDGAAVGPGALDRR